MRRLLPTALIAAIAALAAPALAQTGGEAPPPSGAPPTTAPAPPPPTPKLKVQKPTNKRFIREGQPDRLLLGGTWYFRPDDQLQGEQQRFFAQRSLAGWTPVGVASNWNGADTALDAQGVGWYRKDFKLPKPPKRHRWSWIVRFESVNAHATVWLNGRRIGGRGPAYLPFELDLKGLKQGHNRLVVRVTNRRSGTDLTHWRPYGRGGWWNFGGIGREVYVRPVDTVDIQDMAVTPKLRCVRCSTRVQVRLLVRNLSRKDRRVQLTLALRRKKKTPLQVIQLNPRGIPAGAVREVVTSFRIQRPKLWRPGHPNLYSLTASASLALGRGSSTTNEVRSRFYRAFGVRKIERRPDGEVLLNGHKLQLGGASIHEDDPRTGAALTARQRSGLVRSLVRLHASIVRAHYPLHPAFLEAFDRLGIMVWDEAPVYQLPNAFLDLPSVRNAALSATRRMVLRDRTHPSVLAWSLGNELAFQESEHGVVGPGFARYLADGAGEIRSLDKTRLVALDRHLRIGEPAYSPAFDVLDALGINEYFGWYRSAPVTRSPSRTDELGPVLDGIHAQNPRKALFITEFGAESTGSGSETVRGTFGFQSSYLRAHLAIQATKPYVNGSIVWILKDFRVGPNWTGGNDPARSTPPWNNKGLIDQSGAYKPAFGVVSSVYGHRRPLR